MRVILFLTLVVILVQSLAAAQTTTPRRLVGNLKNNSLADGCGCYFRFRGMSENDNRYIFFSSIENDDKTAWMNIAGQDLKLKLEKQSGPLGTDRERVGSQSSVRYAAGDVTVNGTYVVTRVCAPNDENCESTGYNVTFVVKKGARSQVVKAKGGCGC
jgi:hypothetical protein